MLRRSSLFADDPVMDAEFEYGDLGSESLTAEEEYGALGSQSLFAEELYGDDIDDDDDFGALGSSSLFAEEEYGDDIDDDDDDFGAGLEREGAHRSIPSAFGDDDDDDDDDDDFGAWYGDDDDAGLTSLESDIDDDLYGAWYGADVLEQRVEASGVTPQGLAGLTQAVNVGVFLPQFLQERTAGEASGWVESVVEKVVSAGTPGDAQEIAAYIAGDPEFGVWDSLGPAGQAALVRRAVASGAFPGMEMRAKQAALESFEQHYQGGVMSAVASAARATPSMVWAFWTQDLPAIWVTLFTEVPLTGVIGEEIARGVGQPNYEEIINSYAIALAIIGLAFPTVYAWMAESINSERGSRLAVDEAAAGYQTVALSPAEAPYVTPPPEAIATGRAALPRPQTILAVGYAAMSAGALLGIFRA
jgi:hypothetical protein